MSEDELAGTWKKSSAAPGPSRAKPWLGQFGTPPSGSGRGRRGKVGDTISNSLGMKFAWVPPGKSWLGGGGGKPGTTEFTLDQGLWCGVYPVTQAEWQAVMGNNPSQLQGQPALSGGTGLLE